MRALSRRNDDPAAASRSFDADRDGFVMGEAGAILVLEELEHAKKRAAMVYAELLGYGVSSDAEHISEPDPTGQHRARAMKMAFADAGSTPRRSTTSTRTAPRRRSAASETRVITRAGCGVRYRRSSSGGPSRVVRSPRAGADVVVIRTYCTAVSLV